MEKNKHAYCIIAHQDPVMFSHLIFAIDDGRNDIFVLIDAKTDISAFKTVTTKYSDIFFLSQQSINWGGYSQIRAEMSLFDAVVLSGKEYDYVHLLSGVDFPIKSQDYIHNFFDQNRGKEFVGVLEGEGTSADIRTKVNHYYLFSEKLKNAGRIIAFLRGVCLRLQYKLGVSRNKNVKFYKGCNWVSISFSFCKYLVKKKDWIKKIFHHTMCADEIFLQTVLMNSPFKENVYNIKDEYDSCKREIDWERGNPYVWKEEDLPRLLSSDAFFARKFSSESIKVVEMLNKEI